MQKVVVHVGNRATCRIRRYALLGSGVAQGQDVPLNWTELAGRNARVLSIPGTVRDFSFKQERLDGARWGDRKLPSQGFGHLCAFSTLTR